MYLRGGEGGGGYSDTNKDIIEKQSLADLTPACTHTHARTLTRAHAQARTYTRTRARVYAPSRTRTHTRTYDSSDPHHPLEAHKHTNGQENLTALIKTPRVERRHPTPPPPPIRWVDG